MSWIICLPYRFKQSKGLRIWVGSCYFFTLIVFAHVFSALNKIRKLTFFKPKPLLGIDITPTAINLLELSQQDDGFCVESYAKMLFTPATSVSTMAQAQGLAIQEAVAEARTRTKWAAAALPSAVMVHKTLSGTDLQEAEIRKEAAKALPYPLQEISVDFQMIGSEIVWVATRAQHVSECVETLALGGLVAKIVEPQRYALERVFHRLLQTGKSVIVVIEVRSPLVLSLVRDRKIILTRELFFEAGNPYQILAEAFQAALKIVPAIDRILLTGEKSLARLNEWAVNIEKSLARLNEWAVNIEKTLLIPTQVADPFKHMTMKPRVDKDKLMAEAPSLLVCCGLALRRFVT